MTVQRPFSRREFIATAALAVAGAGCASQQSTAPEPIIDIHQHLNYGGKRDKHWNQITPARTDAETMAHQHNMGVTQTILLPAGRPCLRTSTHFGQSNGLESTCATNEVCMNLARAHPGEYFFGSNEVPDLEEAPAVIEDYLKKGAICIAEQKFGVECDSPQMQTLYQLAADYRVPILMHWQYGMYNYGLGRFYKMLEKYPNTTFVAHAQTFWANIDAEYKNDWKNLYPTGKIKPGGISDKYLTDYANFYGDLSAGSGNNALKRDPDHARAFLHRHQNKLMFGSDCVDKIGHGQACSGWSTIQMVKEYSGSKSTERKLLYENAKRVYRI